MFVIAEIVLYDVINRNNTVELQTITNADEYVGVIRRRWRKNPNETAKTKQQKQNKKTRARVFHVQKSTESHQQIENSSYI